MIPRILVLGNHESGKSTAAEALARHFGTTVANTSEPIMLDYSAEHCMPVQEVMRRKKDIRQELFDLANRTTKTDPAFYVRRCLQYADIVTGVRRVAEFAACRCYFDWCVWVCRPGYGPDSTDCVSAPYGDETAWNNGTIAQLEEDIVEMAIRAMSIPELYIIGRYRHWLPNRQYDREAMMREFREELSAADIVVNQGLRAYRPIATCLPLDSIFPDGGRIIRECCLPKVRRLRSQDGIVLRQGWEAGDGLDESAGARAEYMAAQEGPSEHVLYYHHDRPDDLMAACWAIREGRPVGEVAGEVEHG